MSANSDYSKFNYADSCSIEDAAMYLMGYPQSYLQAKWVQYSEDPSDGEMISIEGFLYLAEEWEVAKNALEEANKFNLEIIKKQSELIKLTEKYKLARSFRTAIINEIAKGAASKLHIDKVNSPSITNPYITLFSLKEWAQNNFNISILNEIGTFEPEKPLPKMIQQGNEIINAIKKLGHDPKKLPAWSPRQSGVKAAVRELIQHPPLFDNSSIFDRAWERLSKCKDIITFK